MSDREERLRFEGPPNGEETYEADLDSDSASGRLSAGDEQRRRTLLKLTYLRAAEERLREADDLMRQASRLDPSDGEGNAEALQRAVLLARLQFKRGEAEGAFGSLAALLQQAECHLKPQRFLEFAGHFLEIAAGQPGPLDVGLMSRLAERAQACLKNLLAAAGTNAREAREECQQALENALSALLQGARRCGPDSGPGQRLLAMAWALVLAGRVRGRGPCRGRHPAAGLSTASSKSVGLKPEAPQPAPAMPPRQGAALTFFLFRNSRSRQGPPLLVLAALQGRIATRLIPKAARGVIPRLLDWQSRLESSQDREMAPRPNVQQLLPREFAYLAGRRPLKGRAEALFSGPWHIFPAGIFHSVSFEAMPESAGGPSCWGRNRDLRICLGNGGAPGADRRIDFSKGWVGAAASDSPPRSSAGVQHICRLLTDRGFPVQTFHLSPASLSELIEHLGAHRPMALHLAARLDEDDPGIDTPFTALLQRLCNMDMRGTDLVVLSGFSMRSEETGFAAGIEGMAQPLLAAGAEQVIAQRYPVDPVSSQSFLQALYRQLLRRPPPAALGKARDECLKQGMSIRNVGAWSIWL